MSNEEELSCVFDGKDKIINPSLKSSCPKYTILLCKVLIGLIFITISLFFGFSPHYGGAGLYGSKSCDKNSSLVCITSCNIGCLDLFKNRCNPFLNLCNGNRFCILEIESYEYVDALENCTARYCYPDAMCIQNNLQLVPWNLEYPTETYKGTVWGIALVILGFILSVMVSILISVECYTPNPDQYTQL